MSSIDDFQRTMEREIEAFSEGKSRRRPRPAHSRPTRTPGLTVRLAVREKRIALDHEFVHQSRSISRLEATIEAERAARGAGWPIVGHVIDYEQAAQ